MKAIWRDPAQVPADGDTMEAAGPGLAGEASRVPGSGSPPAGASGDPVGQLLLVAVSVYALAALAFDVLAGPPPAISRLIHHADLAVCTVFFVDFLRNLRAAPDKWRYMRTWGWLDLLSSIPMDRDTRLYTWATEPAARTDQPGVHCCVYRRSADLLHA